MSGKSNCEHCANYVYDEEYDCYICQVNLDEDEFVKFMQNTFDNCHYFKFYDEYKMLHTTEQISYNFPADLLYLIILTIKLNSVFKRQAAACLFFY